ncbi:hypothetical protein J6590_058342 [Homalodisca vitripennis]|nr:hypothetical protein J6590_058342 [Homalodisca vitripennis]
MLRTAVMLSRQRPSSCEGHAYNVAARRQEKASDTQPRVPRIITGTLLHCSHHSRVAFSVCSESIALQSSGILIFSKHTNTKKMSVGSEGRRRVNGMVPPKGPILARPIAFTLRQRRASAPHQQQMASSVNH